MTARINYIEGDKIGKCFFISDAFSKRRRHEMVRYANFKCCCGVEFLGAINDVKTGRVSCGCGIRNRINTHGYAKQGKKISEYNTWQNIKNRCLRKSNRQFCNYGGRGISVCERWINSFENFFEDMGLKPTPKHTIERINNDGNYEPLNCKWATRTEQARNVSNNVFIEYKNEKMLLIDWADKVGLNRMTLYNRIFTYKWSIERALTKPKRKY